MGKDNKKIWDRYARFYDFEILRFNKKAYQEMYHMIKDILNEKMDVLEIATGTGLIAINIADGVNTIEAIDFSPKMIDTANSKDIPSNVHFSVQDATALTFEECKFDAVIISNALHIIRNPEVVLENIKRVLKPNGTLIAPTYSHGHISDSSWNLSNFLLKFVGFESSAKWKPEEYVSFIEENGFVVTNWKVLDAAFPLVYLEARKKEKLQ